MKKEDIKNLKVNKDNIKKSLGWKKYVLIGGLIACLLLFNSCHDQRLLATNSDAVYDVIDTTDETLVKEGIVQILDVPNEDFKLKVTYKCELVKNAKWTITGDKQIRCEISTIGLPYNYDAYIDNIHTDTTIRSILPTVDGITQDTMDDRLHGEQITGFQISNTNSYGGINSIEGQNDNFISATYMGYLGASNYVDGQSSSSSTASMTYVHLDERRRTESEYLMMGVYANKIDSVIDLAIMKPKKIVVVPYVNEDGTTILKPISSMSEEELSTYLRDNNGKLLAKEVYKDNEKTLVVSIIDENGNTTLKNISSLTDDEVLSLLRDENGNLIGKKVIEYDKDGNVVYEQTSTSVNSVVEVSVWPYVKYKDGFNRTCYAYYSINDDTDKVECKELSNEEYQEHVKKLHQN